MPKLTTAAFRPTRDIQLPPPTRLLPDGRLHDLVRVLHWLAALDLVDVLNAFDDLAPHGVVLVEEAVVVEADEELAVRAVRALRARHRVGAAHMRLGIELGRQVRIARPAGTGAVRAAGLRHEAVDDPMEHNPVVEALVDTRLDAFDVLWRQVGPKLDH